MTDTEMQIIVASQILSSGEKNNVMVPARFKSRAEWALHLAEQRIIALTAIIIGDKDDDTE